MKEKIRADIFILIFFFSLFTLKTNAQKGYVFKIKYLTGHTYFAQNVTGIGLELTLNGDTADFRKLKSLGIDTSNINLYGGSVDSLSIKSDPLSANDKSSFAIKYSSNIIYAFLNNKKIAIPGNIAVKQETVYGKINPDDVFMADSSAGNMLKDTAEKVVSQFISRLINKIKFPGYPLYIADSFTIDVPVTAPVFSNSMSSINVRFTYKLISVIKDKANFNFTENIDGQFNFKELLFIVKGSGAGKLVYSLKDNYPEYYQNQTDVKVGGKIYNVNINGTMGANIYIKYKVD